MCRCAERRDRKEACTPARALRGTVASSAPEVPGASAPVQGHTSARSAHWLQQKRFHGQVLRSPERHRRRPHMRRGQQLCDAVRARHQLDTLGGSILILMASNAHHKALCSVLVKARESGTRVNLGHFVNGKSVLFPRTLKRPRKF